MMLEMPDVRKSDQTFEPFDSSRITNRLLKDTQLCEMFRGKEPMSLGEAQEITKQVELKIRELNLKELSGPLIREITNMTLLDKGLISTRNMCSRVGLSVSEAVQIVIGQHEDSKENANLQENAETAHKKIADKISKELYLLLADPRVADRHNKGDLHIHDLEYFGTRPFCQDWDLRYFLYYGLMPDGTGNKSSVAGPAKKAEVAVLHAVKALGSAQTNFAGGQGFYNFLTFLAPYFEGLSYPEIEQLMQMFVYEMTQMMVARGGQLVFSSVQLTPGVPKLWRNEKVVSHGRVWQDKTYGQYEREVRLAFKALMTVMIKGDYWGKPFNFPKPEISIEPDFLNDPNFAKPLIKRATKRIPKPEYGSGNNRPWSEEDAYYKIGEEIVIAPSYEDLYLLAFKLAAEYGTPYFDNQMPAYRGAGEGISCYQCCAYQFGATEKTDSSFKDKVQFINGQHFSMGSWQVVSLNCPRGAYIADGDTLDLLDYYRKLMDSAVEVFQYKNLWMKWIKDNGRMPFATQQPKDPFTGEKGNVAVDLSGLVYTIGLVGLNEALEYHYGAQIHEDLKVWQLGIYIVAELKKYAQELSKRTGMKIVLARTPAESTAMRFAVLDLRSKEFGEKAQMVVKGDLPKALAHLNESHNQPVYYTNGTHVTPGAKIPLAQRIKLESVFFPIVDGGNIFHIFLGEKEPDAKALMNFAFNLSRHTQIGYFAFSKNMTVCLSCSKVNSGLQDACPDCGSTDVDHIARITGYLSAVSGWNDAKQQELKDRTLYDL